MKIRVLKNRLPRKALWNYSRKYSLKYFLKGLRQCKGDGFFLYIKNGGLNLVLV